MLLMGTVMGTAAITQGPRATGTLRAHALSAVAKAAAVQILVAAGVGRSGHWEQGGQVARSVPGWVPSLPWGAATSSRGPAASKAMLRGCGNTDTAQRATGH